MIAFLKRLWRDRRGNALVIAAAALPLVLGSAGLASDTIEWALWKRQLQRAADSAAMAGVYTIAQDEGSRTNVIPAVDRDLAINNHVGITTTRTAGVPTTGAYASDPHAVRVTLAVQKALSFSSFFLSAAPTITASATATIVPSGTYCVVSLIDIAQTGITATGNSSVNLGCGMITNSTSMGAAIATGSTNVTASPIAAVGGIAASDNWGSGTILQPFTMAQADPFADVPPPTFPTGNCGNVNVNANATATLDPGCYGNMTLNGDVTLNPGIYILDAGSLSIGAQAHVRCASPGCTFVLSSRTAATNPSSIGNVDINGGAEVDLVASESGTYEGIIMYQDRRAVSGTSANQNNHLNGNSESSFVGAFYFPSQNTTFNGTAGMTTTCMQLVAYTVTFSGNMNIDNNCDDDSDDDRFVGKQVRLVE